MINVYQLISFVALAPLYFPVFFYCPFSLPYLYCFGCPVRCPWWQIRGLVLLLALGLNVRKNTFCRLICPFGTIQTFFFKIKLKKIALPSFARGLRYLSLLLILIILVLTKLPQLGTYKFAGFSLSQIFVSLRTVLLAIFLLSMAFSLFNNYFFCQHLSILRRKLQP